MVRRSPLLLALLLLASSATLAKGNPPPKAEAFADMPRDLQPIGWSKDEKKFAVRVYSLTDENDMEEPPPYCPGYVDHRGKKFRGGLMLQLYEGSKASQTWTIQDSEPCTPPEKARDRLTEAKAVLAQQEVDLQTAGAAVLPRKTVKPISRGKGKTITTTATTPLVLPSGPWARQTVTVSCRVEQRDLSKSEEDWDGTYTSRATFTVSLRSGKKPTLLGEFTLGPTEWSAMQAGHWTPTFDRLFLAPSGKRFVLVAHLSDGNMRGGSESSVILGLVELPEHPGSAAPTSVPAR